MPAFILKRIQALKTYTNLEIFVFEWRKYATDYVVQREEILKLIPESNFFSCGWDKSTENKQKTIVSFCLNKGIDIIHIDEIPEGFDSFNPFNLELQKELYHEKYPWKIVETCHNIYFNPDEKKVCHPDAYACVTNHHIDSTFANTPSHKMYIPFPIDVSIQTPQSKSSIKQNKGWLTKGEFHILNVGLWTQGKNQKYAIEIAKSLWEKYRWTYIFHFIGNQASNFFEYWDPLMKDLPPNVFVHGERNDTDLFFKMCDLMLFTSTWECNPIVLKEAISNNIKIMANNLPHYNNEYTPYITPLIGDAEKDKESLINIIHSNNKYKIGNINQSKEFALNHLHLYQTLLNENITRADFN